MRSRGRKAKVFSEKDIIYIIESYVKSANIIGKIKYKDVFLFSQQMYLNKEHTYLLSEDFWRKVDRQGRDLIDHFNQERMALTKTSNDKHIIVPTKDVVNEFSTDSISIQKKIINKLKVNEYGYKSLIKQYTDLKEKEVSYLNTIKQLQLANKEIKEKNDVYEQVLLQWAHISSKKDLPLINTITTGKSRTEIVENLFKDMFTDNPNMAYKDINKKKQDNNIIPINKNKKNTLIDDLNL